MGQSDINRVAAGHLKLRGLPEIIRISALSWNVHVLTLFSVSGHVDCDGYGDGEKFLTGYFAENEMAKS